MKPIVKPEWNPQSNGPGLRRPVHAVRNQIFL